MQTTEVQFDTTGDRLVWPDGEIALPWRVARFLEMLDSAHGGLVPRERAQAELWRDVIVTRNSFDQLLAQTRRCLQEAGIDPALLETVPRQGCRLKLRFAAAPASPTRSRMRIRHVAAAALALIVAALAWFSWPAADYTCRMRAAPVEAGDGEHLMHLFSAVEDFEAFRAAQQAAGKSVRMEGEPALANRDLLIACAEN